MDVIAASSCALVAVEVRAPGQPLTRLADPVALGAALGLRDSEAGDAVTFDADLPHHFENPGTEEAVLLAVVSAGLRRS